MKWPDRDLRRIAGGKMISREEYEAARAEVPALGGLEKKVEKAMAPSPPE
jgi:hypothetical protein